MADTAASTSPARDGVSSIGVGRRGLPARATRLPHWSVLEVEFALWRVRKECESGNAAPVELDDGVCACFLAEPVAAVRIADCELHRVRDRYRVTWWNDQAAPAQCCLVLAHIGRDDASPVGHCE